MNSDSLGALMRPSLSIAQDPQVAAAAGLDHAGVLQVRLCSCCRSGARGVSGPSGLAHGVGKCQQVVLGWARVHELAREPDDLPAQRDGLSGTVWPCAWTAHRS